ncbi:ABC transporter substrate-binding protein [Aeromicrobium wangtongii]|uniref:ABC transporter substrate-binding protein n=1 Tax=Aeromicrobium wangtongii TaxID=2969247 RepID=A0ABY5M496_9ACTN|nr:ABC transporter substrate-binding protein [Aeromicrobium wangtongii]MCD9198643.1 ABC transporter substrate-binding protein [Aeromicrobium wangtongii]UUP12667.1 ABC transporter substrate-binding protein [Aeromicrobium wangtongii]
MTSTRSALALCGVVSILALAACGGGSGSGSDAEEKITLLTAAMPETLNPIAGYGNTGKGKINEGLLTLSGGADELPELVPNLAAAPPEVSADATSWTVAIQPDVTFSDGSALDAGDVVSTYEAIMDEATASPIAGDLVNLRSVEAVDETTVRFTLKQPQVSFKTLLLIGIAPSETITAAQKVEESVLNQEPIGTGPYVVDSFTPERLVLTPNQRYRKKAPQVEKVVYLLAADDNTRVQRMTAGEFDGTVLPPRLAETFADRDGFDVVGSKTADWRGLSLPPDNPFTSDPAARMALNIGIDRDEIITGVLAGRGRAASGFIPPEYGEYYDPTAVFDFDRDRANQMLEDAGWVRGKDGIRTRGGERAAFTLMYRPSDLLRRDLSAAFASQVLELGVDVTLQGVDFAQAEPRIATDAILLGGGDTPYDVDSQVFKMLHSSYPEAGSFYDNPSMFADPEMDRQLEAGRTSLDEHSRVAAYRKVQDLYVRSPSMVVLAFVDHMYVQKTSVAKAWDGTSTLLEPHEHGTAWGPWVDIDLWTARDR